MKKLCLATCITLAAAALTAAPATVTAVIKDMPIYQPQNYSIRKGCSISNQHGQYTFTLVRTKALGKAKPDTQLRMNAGTWGFSPQVRFFNLVINGIAGQKLVVKPEDIKAYRDGENAGADILFNYDGTKICLRFYMRPDSPVLWGAIMPLPDSVEPIKSAYLEISLTASQLVLSKERKAIFKDVYSRQVITPVRTIDQNKNMIRLKPEDTRLVFQDTIYDGSGPDKGQGPCVVIVDHSQVEVANLRLTNFYASVVSLKLKPDFKEFRFGLFQQNARISNSDFAKRLAAEADKFDFKK